MSKGSLFTQRLAFTLTLSILTACSSDSSTSNRVGGGISGQKVSSKSARHLSIDEGTLYVSTSSGIDIYDIASDPKNPIFVSNIASGTPFVLVGRNHNKAPNFVDGFTATSKTNGIQYYANEPPAEPTAYDSIPVEGTVQDAISYSATATTTIGVHTIYLALGSDGIQAYDVLSGSNFASYGTEDFVASLSGFSTTTCSLCFVASHGSNGLVVYASAPAILQQVKAIAVENASITSAVLAKSTPTTDYYLAGSSSGLYLVAADAAPQATSVAGEKTLLNTNKVDDIAQWNEYTLVSIDGDLAIYSVNDSGIANRIASFPVGGGRFAVAQVPNNEGLFYIASSRGLLVANLGLMATQN